MIARRSLLAKFGGEQRQITSLKTSSALNDRPRASFMLPASIDPPLDYLAQLQLIFDGSPEQILFTGFVDAADPQGSDVAITAIGAPELGERATGSLRLNNVPAVDAVYVLAREAGFSDEQLRLEGIEELRTEIFEVLVPVAGLELDEPLRTGDVSLVPAAWGAASTPVAAAPFKNLTLEPYSCVAITMETASRMFDAERAANARIEMALDGLLASALYGLSAKPSGAIVPFARSVALGRPRRLAAACVYGLGSDRMWVRETGAVGIIGTVNAALLSRRWRDLHLHLPPATLRDALAALRRAADETQSSVQRGQALWDTIEFLTAGVRVPRSFSKSDGRAIHHALKDVSLTIEQRRRLDEVLQRINEPSLAMKMAKRAADDGVPLALSEVELLKRIRDARNASAHGRSPVNVSDHDLRWAVSIVSRLVIYRWYRLLTNASESCQCGEA